MAFDFHIVIEEDNRRLQALQQVARDQHVTAEEAADQVFEAGVRALVTGRKSPHLPNLEVAESMPIFGMFAEKPEFSKAIEQVIANRSERYVWRS
jgi:ribonuclease BN (tRNA processing enzyme)